MRPNRTLERLAALTASVAVLLSVTAGAGDARPQTLEYAVKAAYLYQFARFTEWPDKAADDRPLCIGVLGDDGFGAALDKALVGRAVGNRAVLVRRSRLVTELDGCDIVFVSQSEAGERLGAVLQRASRWPALTVGESETFTRDGGMVRFFVEGNHVRFEVNLLAVEGARLRLSSRLLALALLTGAERGGR
jgi:hypothetical protein